jgi:hypothetical protein
MNKKDAHPHLTKVVKWTDWKFRIFSCDNSMVLASVVSSWLWMRSTDRKNLDFIPVLNAFPIENYLQTDITSTFSREDEAKEYSDKYNKFVSTIFGILVESD